MSRHKDTPDAPATDPVAGAIGEPAATPGADYAQEREIAGRKGLPCFWVHVATGAVLYDKKHLSARRNRPDQFTEIPA